MNTVTIENIQVEEVAGEKPTSLTLPVKEYSVLQVLKIRDATSMKDLIRHALSVAYPEYKKVYSQTMNLSMEDGKQIFQL